MHNWCSWIFWHTNPENGGFIGLLVCSKIGVPSRAYIKKKHQFLGVFFVSYVIPVHEPPKNTKAWQVEILNHSH